MANIGTTKISHTPASNESSFCHSPTWQTADRSTRQSLPFDSSPDPQITLQLQHIQNASRYKTRLCRTFLETEACRYGDNCRFAHGKQELRVAFYHPRYKTDLCRPYHKEGFCPYGPYCRFIHNMSEARGTPLQDVRRQTSTIIPQLPMFGRNDSFESLIASDKEERT